MRLAPFGQTSAIHLIHGNGQQIIDTKLNNRWEYQLLQTVAIIHEGVACRIVTDTSECTSLRVQDWSCDEITMTFSTDRRLCFRNRSKSSQ